MKAFYFLLYLLFAANAFFGQREVIIYRSVKIDCSDALKNSLDVCNYGLLIPASRKGKQEAVEYTYPSLKPTEVNLTEEGNYYLMWKNIPVKDLAKNPLEVKIRMRLHPYDLKTAKHQPSIDKKDLDTASYLIDEENFRINAENIQSAAKKIKGANREEIVKNIFQYVTEHLDYHIFYEQDRGAKGALKEGKGDCTEYSELMVTLCRARNIPARIVMGLIPHSDKTIGYHNWVEVFFPQYGWVAFDPTWADHPKATTTFYKMKNTYVQLSYKRFLNTIVDPCNTSLLCPSGLSDVCIDLTRNISRQIEKMRECYANKEYNQANTLLDTLISYEPDNFIFWGYKSAICQKTGDLDNGIEHIFTALKLAETNFEKAQCYFSLGELYSLKNNQEEAVKYLKEAIALGRYTYNNLKADKDLSKLEGFGLYEDLLKELKRKEEENKKEK